MLLRPLNLVSDPLLLLASDGATSNPSSSVKLPHYVHPAHRPNFQIRVQKRILCAASRRNRYSIQRSGKLMLESACMIASKMRLLPEPVELILREFGGGSGGGNGSWNGFGGRGWFGGGNRREMKFGMLGILVVCCAVGFWLGFGKELGLGLDADTFLGGLGLLLFGLTVEGWKRGARDWILGFCCCAFVVLVSKRDEFRRWVGSFGGMKRNRRRKMRVF